MSVESTRCIGSKFSLLHSVAALGLTAVTFAHAMSKVIINLQTINIVLECLLSATILENSSSDSFNPAACL